jgi:hypothetical protein
MSDILITTLLAVQAAASSHLDLVRLPSLGSSSCSLQLNIRLYLIHKNTYSSAPILPLSPVEAAVS